MATLSETIEEMKEALLSDMEKQDDEEEDEDGVDGDMDDMSIDEDDNNIADGRNDKEAAEREMIETVRRSYIGPKTRYNYHGATTRFVVWLFENGHQNLLDTKLLDALKKEAEKSISDLHKPALEYISKATHDYHPIDLTTLTEDHFLSFLLSRTPTGKFLSKSTYGTYRSGLLDLFRSCGIDQSNSFKRDLEQSFAGLKRMAQVAKGKSGIKLGQGKLPMSFLLYQKLCSWMIADGSKEALFCWCFLTITWNLVCRSKNTISIHRNHISWENDSLTIQFAHTKTDITGNSETFKRHIYANPEFPSICPILALSAYFATTPCRGEGLLFDGSNQYERFRKNLQGLVKKHQDEISQMGIDYKEIGVHSIRKGAATYACNGSTCGPSIGALCNRAGWTMGTVKDTYLRYEAAQDQFVGRVVAGLDVNSHKFSVSPPFFLSTETDFALVKADIGDLFPFPVMTNYMQLLTFCLASLIHSKNMLMECLGHKSPLRSTICLVTDGLRSTVCPVVTKYAHNEMEMGFRLTGIPPHALLLAKIDEYQQRNIALAQSQKEFFTTMVQTIIDSFRAELNARSIGGGQVTMNHFREILKPLENKLEEFIQAHPSSQPLAPERHELPVQNSTVHRHRLYVWRNGQMRRLPQGYLINRKLTLFAAWKLWFYGDAEAPPFRYVESKDLSENCIKKGRQRPRRGAEVRALNNLRFVCERLNEAAELGNRTPSMSELVTLYNSDRVKAVLPPIQTQHNRLRRADELNWGYACTVMKNEMG
jgi:hypothetical protein